MNFFKIFVKIFKFFSVYVDSSEKKIDKFLKHIKRKSNHDLIAMVQEDLVRLSIFFEYKFKGYKKLNKRYRKKLYYNAELIKTDFQSFLEKKADKIEIDDVPQNLKGDLHFKYLLSIMKYLQPGERLQYRESSNFEKLLRDPNSEKLVGDCNQIVTLYIYLFSLRYDVSELHVKILPDHICLHYNGIDIETTTGRLAYYDVYTFISDVEEIVPTNILDISDPDEKQYEVNPKSVLKSAELAYQFSSHRETVEKNLFVAYHNLAVYYAKQKSFSKANLFANKSGKTKLQKSIKQMEAVNYLKNKKYKKAAEIFRIVGDTAGEKACYQNELSYLFIGIKNLRAIQEYKKKKSTLYRMKDLALKINNQGIVDFVNKILKQF